MTRQGKNSRKIKNPTGYKRVQLTKGRSIYCSGPVSAPASRFWRRTVSVYVWRRFVFEGSSNPLFLAVYHDLYPDNQLRIGHRATLLCQPKESRPARRVLDTGSPARAIWKRLLYRGRLFFWPPWCSRTLGVCLSCREMRLYSTLWPLQK